MQIYIALLRGINVSGQKLIKMVELKALFESMNLQNVTTYIQSGNIVFEARKTDAYALETSIAQQIMLKFGFEVPVTIKTIDQWRILQQSNPFLPNLSAELNFLHLTLLSDKPDATHIQSLDKLEFAPDQFKISNTNIYLYCPGGYGKTKLSNNFFESKLKVKATTRNWNTVNQLLEMAEKLAAS